jgi:hypothetical protein
VVAIDVVGDLLPRLVERLELGAPDEPLLQLPEPAFDEGLRLGVAVAAAAMRDAMLGESLTEAAAGEGGAVVRAERQRVRLDPASSDGRVDELDRFVGTAAQLERPADDLARAAVDRRIQLGPALLCDPHAGHVEMPELVGPLDPEEAGTAAPAKRPVPLQQPLLAHQPLRAFPIHLAAELTAGKRGDHPAAVGRVSASDVDDQAIDGINDCAPSVRRSSLRRPIQPGPVHLHHARDHRRPAALGDQLAGPGERAHSQPLFDQVVAVKVRTSSSGWWG